jgi:hypothetical protein
MEWFLPRKQSYTTYTDSIDPSLIKKKTKDIFNQYYLLKDQLKKYRQIEKRWWDSIKLPAGYVIKLETVYCYCSVRKDYFLMGS